MSGFHFFIFGRNSYPPANRATLPSVRTPTDSKGSKRPSRSGRRDSPDSRSASVESNPGKRRKPWAALRSHAGTLTCYREPRGVSAQKGSLYIEKFRQPGQNPGTRSLVEFPNSKPRTRRAHDRSTKTGIAGHDRRFAVRGLQRTCPAPSGFGRCLSEHCPSVPSDCNPRLYNVFERSLGGLLKLASQDSNRSLGRFCLYAVHGAKTLPNPFKIPAAARS
jgi:hypothetical protein